jgi:WD40 repeat protein
VAYCGVSSGVLCLLDTADQNSRQVESPVPYGFAWAPDGSKLAIGSHPGLAISDARSGKWQRDLPNPPSGTIRAPAWSPDGKRIAFSGEPVAIWDLDSDSVRKLRDRGTNLLAWSPDGKTLATTEETNHVGLWDPDSGQLLTTLRGHTGDVKNLAWSHDGKMLASAAADGSIRLWDIDSGDAVKAMRVTGSAHMAWTPEGTAFAAEQLANSVRVWDASTARPLVTLVALQNPHWLVVSPEGHFRASPRAERELVYVVQTDTGQETLTPAEFAAKYVWKNDPGSGAAGAWNRGAGGPPAGFFFGVFGRICGRFLGSARA